MRIAYLSLWDHKNIKSWSGTVQFIFKYLEKAGHEVIPAGEIEGHSLFTSKLKSFYYRKLLNKGFLTYHTESYLKKITPVINDRIKRIHPDFIFCPGSIQAAFIEKIAPIAIYADMTLDGALGYYPDFSNLPKWHENEAKLIDRQALNNADVLIFASKWAYDSAISNPHIKSKNIFEVPFGANINSDFEESEINELISRRLKMPLRLLFVGVNWELKGGEYLIKAMTELVKNESNIYLDIVGCSPEIPNQVKSNITVHGFLNKSVPEEREKIHNLYKDSSLFVLPSLAEAFGIVFAEANAYGMPILGTNTGGIPSVIKDGINGFLLDSEDLKNDIVEKVLKFLRKDVDYETMAHNSFNEYKTRLNWDVSIRKISSILGNYINHS